MAARHEQALVEAGGNAHGGVPPRSPAAAQALAVGRRRSTGLKTDGDTGDRSKWARVANDDYNR